MSDKKGWGSTVAGWFIEREEPIGSTGIEADRPGDSASWLGRSIVIESRRLRDPVSDSGSFQDVTTASYWRPG